MKAEILDNTDNTTSNTGATYNGSRATENGGNTVKSRHRRSPD